MDSPTWSDSLLSFRTFELLTTDRSCEWYMQYTESYFERAPARVAAELLEILDSKSKFQIYLFKMLLTLQQREQYIPFHLGCVRAIPALSQ